ncbi:MAG: type VI secretion system baseplate subunit TssF, partial [Planctomycetia bacterium]
FERRLEVIVFLRRSQVSLEEAATPDLFRLGCTPVVNLFEQTAEPVQLTHQKTEYLVLPDVAHPKGMEVHSVLSVTGADPTKGTNVEYQPFYSFRHGDGREKNRRFWHASRRPSMMEGDAGRDVFLHLCDVDFNPRGAADQVLVVRTLCTNRDLPSQFRLRGAGLDFDAEFTGPFTAVHCLRTPSPTQRPPLRRGLQWQLVSHLTLNHLSLTEGPHKGAPLREILRLYDDHRSTGGAVDGITSVESRRVMRRLDSPESSGFCRGVEVTIEFDGEKFVGANLHLFANVLDRFLGMYATVNSFTQLVARLKGSPAPFKTWPPRAGEHPLL